MDKSGIKPRSDFNVCLLRGKIVSAFILASKVRQLESPHGVIFIKIFIFTQSSCISALLIRVITIDKLHLELGRIQFFSFLDERL